MAYRIKHLIDGIFKNPNIAVKAKENLVFPLWPSVVGDRIALKASPYKLEQGILKVLVVSSTWAQELSFMKEQILRGYLDLVGEELVKDIRFYTGKNFKEPEIKKAPAVEQLPLDFDNKYRPPDEFQLSRINLSAEMESIIDEQVKNIKDETLKAQMKKLMEKDFKIKVWKERMGWKPCPNCQALMDPSHKVCIICNIEENISKKKKSSRKKKENKK